MGNKTKSKEDNIKRQSLKSLMKMGRKLVQVINYDPMRFH